MSESDTESLGTIDNPTMFVVCWMIMTVVALWLGVFVTAMVGMHLPSGLPIVAGARLRARPRPALRFGPWRARGFFPTSLPCRVAGRTPRPDLDASPRLPAEISSAKRQKAGRLPQL